jgi:hypothetical protein
MHLTLAELERMAAPLGHSNLHVRQSRRGWGGHCSCGFGSRKFLTAEMAEQSLVDHFLRAAAVYMRNARASGGDPGAIVADLEARRAM